MLEQQGRRTGAGSRPVGELPSLDVLVAATPATRDRVVDFLRAASIGVVVLWHWSLSITHWNGNELVMPNPIDYLPGTWAATWVLQVMPVFFFVGGYANLAGWEAITRDGGGAARFLGARMRRLLLPLLPFLAVWLVFDLAVQATGRRSVLDWGIVVFVPLWFIGVYAAVVAAVPITARLHRAWGWRVPLILAAAVLAADVLRLGPGWGGAAPGLVGSACVWLFCHQLGYFWRDGTLAAGGWPRAAAVAAAGFAALIILTTLGPYPHSMVAMRGDDTSNMFPTTAAIVALATFQLGLVMLVRSGLNAWLQQRGPWRAVVGANGVTMPVFIWHMTALVAFLWLYERAGFTLSSEPTTEWWLSRGVWIVGPGLLLAGLLAALSRLRRAAK
ncbi:acyltransferase family protein [Aldersonia kunmingensis]|uniref:acyltransferase family protein n=1 Tax=Aldersonia kunmingensis TaxID=408066 RepID=UPI000AE43CD7|nr:acyltransferase family protein [Aldersonia kunmingensis]